MADNRKTTTLVSSLSKSLRRGLLGEEEIQQVKEKHRDTLDFLVQDYLRAVQDGEAQGIRHAKDLIDVIKADLLLLGEATDRTEELSAIDQAKTEAITQELDMEDPNVKALMDKITMALNNANDEQDR